MFKCDALVVPVDDQSDVDTDCAVQPLGVIASSITSQQAFSHVPSTVFSEFATTFARHGDQSCLRETEISASQNSGFPVMAADESAASAAET